MFPENQFDLSELATRLRDAVKNCGLSDTGTVRTVLVEHGKDQWVNHCTLVRLGVTDDAPAPSPTDQRARSARLIGIDFSVEQTNSVGQWQGLLTTWRIALPKEKQTTPVSPLGPRVDGRLCDFQEIVNVSRNSSRGQFSTLPCWVLDLHNRAGESSRHQATPRGPFITPDGRFSESLGALVELWTGDPTHPNSAIENAYRIIVPDRRGYLTDVMREGEQLHVRVAGVKTASITCAMTTVVNGRRVRESKKVVDGFATLAFPMEAISLELYLLDENGESCDAYSASSDYPSWGHVFGIPATAARDAKTSEFTQAADLLDLMTAPRYAGPRHYLTKALAYLAQGPQQDLPNAAKEAVSALEGMCQIVARMPSAKMGALVKELRNQGKLDGGMAKSWESFWGSASNEPGVRHGSAGVPEITAEKAQLTVGMAQEGIRYLLGIDTN